MKLPYMLMGVLLIASVTTGFPTELPSSCSKQCYVCETSCKQIDCDEVPCCQVKPEPEFHCPDGFTFNGAGCMQDYSSKLHVQPLCGVCCKCRKQC